MRFIEQGQLFNFFIYTNSIEKQDVLEIWHYEYENNFQSNSQYPLAYIHVNMLHPSGPIVAAVLEKDNAVDDFRTLIGCICNFRYRKSPSLGTKK